MRLNFPVKIRKNHANFKTENCLCFVFEPPVHNLRILVYEIFCTLKETLTAFEF